MISDLTSMAISRLVDGTRDAIIRLQCRRAARRLVDASESIDRMMRAALAVVAGTKTLAKEEVAWQDRIEQMRRSLASSRDEMSVHNADRTVGAICRQDAVPPDSALLLFALIRAFRPSICFELGTSLGVSAAYQAAALSLNGSGYLITIEDEPGLVTLARENLRSLGLDLDRVVIRTGHFDEVIQPILDEAREGGGIGFAFVDGDHTGDRTIRHIERLIPALAHPAVVVFDDIYLSFSMHNAWRRIAIDARAALVVDLFNVGIVVFH